MASIELQNVSVHFLLPHAQRSLRGMVRAAALGGEIRRDHGKMGVAAIDSVSLTLRDGDRLGLVGHNGAGKTTLLRVLAGILPPTSGRIRLEGRISSLLSIHHGLNPKASGYSNIRFRARHMGVSNAEIDAKFDDIAEFSELGEYLHLPMRTYSSGMKIRLSFAIATAFEPDILILDEWLSAGDEKFQIKAATRLKGLIERAGVFVFASHNKNLQKSMCNQAIVLHHGRPVFHGGVEEAFAFEEQLQKKTA